MYVLYDIMRAMNDSDSNVAVTCHLAGAALAFAYYRLGIRVDRVIPTTLSLRSLRPKPKLRVHDPDARYGELDRRADRILDKLYRQGQESLTAEERRILEDYSRRMRQKHR